MDHPFLYHPRIFTRTLRTFPVNRYNDEVRTETEDSSILWSDPSLDLMVRAFIEDINVQEIEVKRSPIGYQDEIIEVIRYRKIQRGRWDK